jgi:hypothetical protein
VSFEALRTGAVIRFPYLWAREAAQGETEGRKFRPAAAVGVRVPKPDGEDVLFLFPLRARILVDDEPPSGLEPSLVPRNWCKVARFAAGQPATMSADTRPMLKRIMVRSPTLSGRA